MKCYVNRDYIENFIKIHNKTIFKVTAALILLVVAFFVFCIRDSNLDNNNFRLMNENELDLNNYDFNNETQIAGLNGEDDIKKAEAETNKIYVDIRGAVNKPYVYELDSGMRMYEAIEKAGGLREDADTSNLNLAKILNDQEKITVLTKEEIIQNVADNKVIDEKKLLSTEMTDGYANTVQDQALNLININTATEQELQTLKGVGPSTAGKIISYRDQHGNFQRIEELMNIKGIGEQTFKKYKDKITI